MRVGRDPCVPPPSLAPHSLQKPCHCEPVTDSLVWQSVLLVLGTGVLRIPTTSLRTGLGMTRKFFRLPSLRGRNAPVAIRIPVPLAPLPKGGWHGEAVAGGFLTSPHLLYPSVGATLAVARPYNPFRRGRSPHRPEPSFSRTPGRARGPCPTKRLLGGSPISRRAPKPPHYFSPPLVLPRRMCYNFLIKVES